MSAAPPVAPAPGAVPPPHVPPAAGPAGPATPTGTAPASTSPTGTAPTGTAPDVGAWLVVRRNEGARPDEIAGELVDRGWSVDAAARTALRSLRRADRRPLLWFALCWSVGLAAVGLTTAVHQLLSPSPDRQLAAVSLTVAVVMAPIAGVCAVLARRAEAGSAFTVWSPQRRWWFGTLAACTAVVGLVRLIAYVHAVVSSLVAASPQPLYGHDLAQVAVTLSVAVPLFWWTFSEWRRSDLAISGLRDERPPAGPRRRLPR